MGISAMQTPPPTVAKQNPTNRVAMNQGFNSHQPKVSRVDSSF